MSVCRFRYTVHILMFHRHLSCFSSVHVSPPNAFQNPSLHYRLFQSALTIFSGYPIASDSFKQGCLYKYCTQRFINVLRTHALTNPFILYPYSAITIPHFLCQMRYIAVKFRFIGRPEYYCITPQMRMIRLLLTLKIISNDFMMLPMCCWAS